MITQLTQGDGRVTLRHPVKRRESADVWPVILPSQLDRIESSVGRIEEAVKDLALLVMDMTNRIEASETDIQRLKA